MRTPLSTGCLPACSRAPNKRAVAIVGTLADLGGAIAPDGTFSKIEGFPQRNPMEMPTANRIMMKASHLLATTTVMGFNVK